MTVHDFERLVSRVTEAIAGRLLDDQLAAYLSKTFPLGGEVFESIREACRQGIEAGWMCQQEAGGIRYGRVIKPGAALQDFSVDVVDMKDVKGPHHVHPNGEIDMIMPITPTARFDGHGAGWCVYGPGSAHHPTVTEGEALVLYLLPKGAIKFTKT